MLNTDLDILLTLFITIEQNDDYAHSTDQKTEFLKNEVIQCMPSHFLGRPKFSHSWLCHFLPMQPWARH